jgi:hypothetical protein
VLNEAVLCRVVGGPDVMRNQIRHMIEMAQLPNVTVQVLPFSVGFHSAMTGSFTALRFPETPAMNTVYVQIKGGAIYVEKPLGSTGTRPVSSASQNSRSMRRKPSSSSG